MAIIAPPVKIRENRHMKRLRVIFAVGLLLLFFPVWRALDYQVAVIPSPGLFTFSLALLVLIAIVVPVRLLRPQWPEKFSWLLFLALIPLIWWGSGLSTKATLHHELRHCGSATFTGFLYPIRSVLPPAHQDDLEARNQMCWIRKMVVRLPEQIKDVKELQNYLDLLRKKLLSPGVKYKSSLPLIALLHGAISASLIGPVIETVEIGKLFVDSLHFWKSQYTVEISKLDYPWYAWPHSSFIQWEYALIEDNWESVVSSIQIEQK